MKSLVFLDQRVNQLTVSMNKILLQVRYAFTSNIKKIDEIIVFPYSLYNYSN